MGIFVQSDSEIMSILEEQIDLLCMTNLLAIQNEAENILRNAIQNRVYDYYAPSWYDRTYELLNSIHSDIRHMGNNYTLYVYVDTEMLNYNSFYSGENVSMEVPFWINKGHNASGYLPINGSGEQFYNQFHAYEGRGYLEEALGEMNATFGSLGFTCILMDD